MLGPRRARPFFAGHPWSTATPLARESKGRPGAAGDEVADGAAFESGDVLKVLERLRRDGEQFDVVICDPPKFARHSRGVSIALKGYLRLNLAAVRVLSPEGILATCSCSGLVERRVFTGLIGGIAEESHRGIQILEQRGAGADHPIAASCLESDYLKCVICRVD